MGKRSSKPNTDADPRQDELDLDQGEGENGTLSAPTGAASGSGTDRPSADMGGEAKSLAEAADAAAPPPVPALPFEGPLDIGMGPHGADAIGSMRSFRLKRIAALAAAVAFAAALGALAGSLATSGFGTSSTAAIRASTDEASLRLALGRMEQDLATLRANVEKSAQDLEERTNRIAKSLDRNERAQAEPAKKLAKISAAIERLERHTTRSALAAAGAADVTGAIGGRATAPGTGPATILRGWTLRDVRNGAALVEGRDGLIHIVPGDRLPGLGKVHTIQRRDGRWVVVTSRGLIVDR